MSTGTTLLIRQAQSGDNVALSELYDRISTRLRGLARTRLRHEKTNDPLLQTTLLVNNAILGIMRFKDLDIESTDHFYALASHLMKRDLVTHARSRNTAKRNHGQVPVSVDALPDEVMPESPLDVGSGYSSEDISSALEYLAKSLGESLRLVVVLRWAFGLSVDETANIMGLSTATIKRYTRTAMGFLYEALESDSHELND